MDERVRETSGQGYNQFSPYPSTEDPIIEKEMNNGVNRHSDIQIPTEDELRQV